ncbi:hypothetical protein Droror1_Dr00008589 [Drosera rotundifolia]
MGQKKKIEEPNFVLTIETAMGDLVTKEKGERMEKVGQEEKRLTWGDCVETETAKGVEALVELKKEGPLTTSKVVSTSSIPMNVYVSAGSGEKKSYAEVTSGFLVRKPEDEAYKGEQMQVQPNEV